MTLTNDLIAVWEFNDPAGGPFVDAAGGHLLISYGRDTPVAYAPGKIGPNAVALNALASWLSAGDHPDLRFGDTPWSLAFWHRGGQDTVQEVFRKLVPSGESEVQVVLMPYHRRILVTHYAGTSGVINARVHGQVLTAFDWTHYAATWDGVALRVYVNGVEVGQVSGGATSYSVSTASIGLNVGGSADAGIVDQIAKWNRALTDSEIIALYNGMSGQPISPLL